MIYWSHLALGCLILVSCTKAAEEENIKELGKLLHKAFSFPTKIDSVQSIRIGEYSVFVWPEKLVSRYEINQLRILSCTRNKTYSHEIGFPHNFERYRLQETNGQLILLTIWNKRNEYALIDVFALEPFSAQTESAIAIKPNRSFKIDLVRYFHREPGGKRGFNVIDAMVTTGNYENLMLVAEYEKSYYNPFEFFLGGGHQDTAMKICIVEYTNNTQQIKYSSEKDRNSYHLQLPAKMDGNDNIYFVIRQEDSKGNESEYILRTSKGAEWDNFHLPYHLDKRKNFQSLDLVFIDNHAFYLWEERLMTGKETGRIYLDGYYSTKFNTAWIDPIAIVSQKEGYLIRHVNDSKVLLGWLDVDGIHLQIRNGQEILFSYVKKLIFKPDYRLLWRAEIDNEGKDIDLLWAEIPPPQESDYWNLIGNAYYERIEINTITMRPAN